MFGGFHHMPYLTNADLSDVLQTKEFISPDLEHQYALLWARSKAFGIDKFLVHLTTCSYKGVCGIDGYSFWQQFDFLTSAMFQLL